MSHHRPAVLSLLIVTVLLAILLLTIRAYGDEIDKAYTPPVCFSEETARAMLVELEKGRLLRDETELLKKANFELERQIEFMIKISQAKDEELAACNETVRQQERLIEDVKPSVWSRILIGVCFGAGLALGLLL